MIMPRRSPSPPPAPLLSAGFGGGLAAAIEEAARADPEVWLELEAHRAAVLGASPQRRASGGAYSHYSAPGGAALERAMAEAKAAGEARDRARAADLAARCQTAELPLRGGRCEEEEAPRAAPPGGFRYWQQQQQQLLLLLSRPAPTSATLLTAGAPPPSRS